MERDYEKRGYLLEDFRLFHLRDAEGPEVDYHYHDFHKLLLLRSGSGAYSVEGCRYLLQPGDIVLVSRGSVHRPEIGGGGAYERIILYLSQDFFTAAPDGWSPEELFSGSRGHVLRLPGESWHPVEDKLLKMEQELSAARPGHVLLSRCLLWEVLIALQRLYIEEDAPLPPPAASGDEKTLVILRYLNDHISEELSIDGLASRFYVSKYHMMRRFRAETGVSIHAYLSDKRLFLARDLMANGASATESCYRCGFKSYSSFSRAYRKRFGATPTGRVRPEEEINE